MAAVDCVLKATDQASKGQQGTSGSDFCYPRRTMAFSSDYIPFAARPGWSNLTPIPQADAPNALVPIAYTEKCACV